MTLLAASCTSTHRSYVFHTLNAADAYQTQDMRNNHCEEGQVFVRKAIGSEPQPAETALYFFAVSWLYEAMSDYYDSALMDWAFIGTKAYYVARNESRC